MVAEIYQIAVGGHVLNLYSEGDVIAGMVARGEQFEPATLAFWHKITKNRGKVLDIGAYSGIFGILAAKNGCDVLAFEPMPNQRRRVIDNSLLNGYSITVRPECVSDKCGEAVILYNAAVRGMTSGASIIRPVAGSEFRSTTAPMLSIDSLALTRCAAIKIDVEGAEVQVLEGARQTIEAYQPTIIAEALSNAAGEAMLGTLPDYKLVAVLDGRNWVMMPRCSSLSTSGCTQG